MKILGYALWAAAVAVIISVNLAFPGNSALQLAADLTGALIGFTSYYVLDRAIRNERRRRAEIRDNPDAGPGPAAGS